jgi:predicted  nucleic acid-binding Zn-ribbon protein
MAQVAERLERETRDRQEALADMADSTRAEISELRAEFGTGIQDLVELRRTAHESHAVAQVAERLERETRDRQEALTDIAASTRVAMSELRAEFGTGVQDLAELRRNHGEFREALDERHAPLVEGLALLEKDIAELRRSRGELREALDERHAPLVEGVALLEKDLAELRRSHGEFREALDARHAPLAEGLDFLAMELAELRRSHGEFREALDAGHAPLVDRVAFIEREIGAPAGVHASTCDRSFEVVGQSLHERVARLEQETLAEQQPLWGASKALSLAARVANVELGLGESATRHARYAEEQNKALYEYHNHHVAIEDRVKCLEQVCEDAANTWQSHAADIRRLWEKVRSQQDDSGTVAVKARLDALEKLYMQDMQSMNLLVEYLQKELRCKSELMEGIKSNQLSMINAQRDTSFGCIIGATSQPTARPHSDHCLSPEISRLAE